MLKKKIFGLILSILILFNGFHLEGFAQLLPERSIDTSRDTFSSLSSSLGETLLPIYTKNPIVLNLNYMEMYIGDSSLFIIKDGSGGYKAQSSLQGIASVTLSGNVGTVKGLSSGTSTIMVVDKQGSYKNIIVKVKEVPTPQSASIVDMKYSSAIDNKYLGGIYIETNGDFKEVGVDYSYIDTKPSNLKKYVFNKSQDNVYASVIIPNCLTSCTIYIRPYIIDTYGKKYYYKNSDSFGTIKYSTENIDSKLPPNSNIAIAPLVTAILRGIDVGFIGWSLYDCNESGWLNVSCALDLGLSFVGFEYSKPIIKGVTKVLKKDVVNLANKTGVDSLIEKYPLTKDSYRFGGLFKWNKSLEKHIFEGDLTRTQSVPNAGYKVDGVHHIMAVKPGKIRITKRTEFSDGTYSANVEGYFDELYLQHKNDASILPENKGWKSKEGYSSFFPDSRDKIKVQEEVEYAWKNSFSVYNDKGTLMYFGHTKDGIKLQFYIENGIITSVFPYVVGKVGKILK